ncbi:MAG: hypothetical protein ACKOEI_03555, partial [Chthoniobacterales bacterium]
FLRRARCPIAGYPQRFPARGLGSRGQGGVMLSRKITGKPFIVRALDYFKVRNIRLFRRRF